MTTERHETAFLVGAVLGGIAGATYGLLNAPQSGAQTRAGLVAQWNAAVERVAQAVAGVEASLREVVGDDEAASAPTVVHPRIESITEPVVTLPDPLEPDPIVETTAATGRGPTPVGVDVVVDGPRTVGG